MRHRSYSTYSPYFAVLALLLLAFTGWQDAYAQGQEAVSLTARAGFESYCKTNHWLPVWVTVENKGKDLNGRIQATYKNEHGGNSTYSVDVVLPTTSRKGLFFYLFPDNSLHNLNIDLLVDGQVLASAALKVSCVSERDLLFGLLTDDPSPFNALSSVSPLSGTARVAHLQIGDLPDQVQGWESLDALVVSGLDTGAISGTQRQALGSWLAQGGTLLVIGGPNWQGVAGGLDEFLPVALDATQTVNSLAGLQDYFKTSTAPEGEAVLALGQPRPGAQVVVEQDGEALIVQKQVGLGTVYYFAADPGLLPLSNWGGMKDVYGSLLTARSPKPTWTIPYWSSYSSQTALSAIPGLGIPSVLAFVGWLGLYILILGPLNYLVLRRLKRQEWAWVTIPVLVVLFTVAAYVSGSFVRGMRPVLNRLVLSQSWDGVSQARVRALVGIYSPGRTKYTLDAGAGFMPYPSGRDDQSQDWLSAQHESSVVVPDILVESAGMKTVALDGGLPASAFTHDLTIHLSSLAPLLSGQITNNGKYKLQDAVLVTPYAQTQLGDFSPGETKQVKITLAVGSGSPAFYGQPPFSPYSYSTSRTGQDLTDKAVRRYALSSVFLSSESGGEDMGNWGIYLVGWVDDPVLPTGLQGSEFEAVDTTLSVSMLSPALQVESGSVMFPASMFIWESSVEDSSPYNVRDIPSEGLVLRYRLAVPFRYRAVESLTLRLDNSNSNSGKVSASLWDWERNEWTPIPNLGWGTTNIPEPAPYVGPAGEIRLRIDGNQDIYYLDAAYFTLVVKP